MTELIAIINGRPLELLSADPEQPEVFSPATLLTQKNPLLLMLENFNFLYELQN
jgi:hypothetical protein